MLITVQCIELYKTLSENSISISIRRGVDQVQDLQGNFLRENSYYVVELGLANCNVPDLELVSA